MRHRTPHHRTVAAAAAPTVSSTGAERVDDVAPAATSTVPERSR